jgi:ribosomal protein L11 methylase PrmA
VLDLGCGDGAIAAALAGAGGRVVAMDLDPWRVDNTRRLADKAPARRWLVTVARAPVVRWLLPAVLEGALFRLVVLPAWEFVASKPPAPAR